jgi:hypothetical protein
MANPSGFGGFVAGKSGNPGGRPRSLASVMHEARKHTGPAISTLVKLMKTARSESVKLGAASAILDRAWGRPIQALQLDSNFVNKRLVDLSPEELKILEERVDMLESQTNMLDLIEDKGTYE